jgi:hypothetical protein
LFWCVRPGLFSPPPPPPPPPPRRESLEDTRDFADKND